MNLNNHFLNTTTSSNIIAMLALIISLTTSIITCNDNQSRNTEVLSIVSSKEFSNVQFRFDTGLPQLIQPSYWCCILTNNGEKTLSITGYDIKQIAETSNIVMYTGLNQGLYDEQLNRINLPINIEPGESKKVFPKVGVMIHTKADSLLKSKIDILSDYTYDQVKIILAEEGIDIFDNKINAIIKGDKIIKMQWNGTNINKDYFGITFKTGRKNAYVEILKFYPSFNDFVQQ